MRSSSRRLRRIEGRSSACSTAVWSRCSSSSTPRRLAPDRTSPRTRAVVSVRHAAGKCRRRREGHGHEPPGNRSPTTARRFDARRPAAPVRQRVRLHARAGGAAVRRAARGADRHTPAVGRGLWHRRGGDGRDDDRLHRRCGRPSRGRLAHVLPRRRRSARRAPPRAGNGRGRARRRADRGADRTVLGARVLARVHERRAAGGLGRRRDGRDARGAVAAAGGRPRLELPRRRRRREPGRAGSRPGADRDPGDACRLHGGPRGRHGRRRRARCRADRVAAARRAGAAPDARRPGARPAADTAQPRRVPAAGRRPDRDRERARPRGDRPLPGRLPGRKRRGGADHRAEPGVGAAVARRRRQPPLGDPVRVVAHGASVRGDRRRRRRAGDAAGAAVRGAAGVRPRRAGAGRRPRRVQHPALRDPVDLLQRRVRGRADADHGRRGAGRRGVQPGAQPHPPARRRADRCVDRDRGRIRRAGRDHRARVAPRRAAERHAAGPPCSRGPPLLRSSPRARCCRRDRSARDPPEHRRRAADRARTAGGPGSPRPGAPSSRRRPDDQPRRRHGDVQRRALRAPPARVDRRADATRPTCWSSPTTARPTGRASWSTSSRSAQGSRFA